MSEWDVQERSLIRSFVQTGKTDAADLLRFLSENCTHPDRHVEYSKAIVNNVAAVTSAYYASLPKRKRVHFLSAICRMLDVAMEMKFWTNRLPSVDGAWYWGEQPVFFRLLGNLVEPLSEMMSKLSLVDRSLLFRKVVLVEGESELIFLRVLKHETDSINFDLPIHNYRGKGELKNLVHYIKEKNRQGIRVLLSNDRDGQAFTFHEKLKKRGCIIDNHFGFKYEFEKAFAPGVLRNALRIYSRQHLDSKVNPRLKDVEEFLSDQRPFLISVKQAYSISITKPKFAGILGKLTAEVIIADFNKVFNEKHVQYDFEIFDFLKFVMR